MCFFLGNPVGLDVSDESLRWWGWLAWKVAVTEVFVFWVLGYSTAPLLSLGVVLILERAGGLRPAPRPWLLPVAFSWHAQQKLLSSETASHFFALEVVHSEKFPGILTWRHRELTLPWPFLVRWKILIFRTISHQPFIGNVLTSEKKYCFQTNVCTPSRLCCSVNLLCLIRIIYSQRFKMHKHRSV